MSKVKIITDGCSDIPTAWRDGHSIECVPTTLVKGGGERILSSEFDDISIKQFYEDIRNGVKFKPNYAALQAYEKVFERYAESGDDIVYIAGSSALYPAYTAGRLAAEHVSEKYGGVKILCVDTKTVGIAQALVAVEAAKHAQAEHSAQEVFEYATDLSAHARYVVTSDTLEYLKRAGKVKASAALFGNLFGIKPIIVNSALGASDIVKKVKGRQNALDMCVEIIKDITEHDIGNLTDNKTIYIAHADCESEANYLEGRIKERIADSDVCVGYMGAPIGALFGPTAIGLFAFGRKSEIRK